VIFEGSCDTDAENSAFYIYIKKPAILNGNIQFYYFYCKFKP